MYVLGLQLLMSGILYSETSVNYSKSISSDIVINDEFAFLGAQGWAASTPGGRGGSIFQVSNLADLKFAIFTPGPRIIVFEVGGVIDLEGESIYVTKPYLTIAGQTAPSPGITFIDGSLNINTHDVIIQHIRFRPGAARHSVGWEPDGISTTGASNIIIDHCSISWAVDENCSASGPRFGGSNSDEWRANTSHTITLSNNIIAEGLSNATHHKGEHSKGSLIHDNATEIAVLNNLYASNFARNPYFKGGARGVVINNYVYNPGESAIRYNLVTGEWGEHDYKTGKMSVVGNILQYGPSTGYPALLQVDFGPCEVYMEDNIAMDENGDDIDLYDGRNDKLVSEKPTWHNSFRPIQAGELKDNIVQNVGSRPWDRGEVDSRIINEMLNGEGKIIDFETEVGGFPDYSTTTTDFKKDEWNLKYMIRKAEGVAITAPKDGAICPQSSDINVEVNTEDYDGNIKLVELFVNGLSEGQDYSSPYQFQFKRDSLGKYELIAITKDENLMKFVSNTVNISVSDTIENKIVDTRVAGRYKLAARNYPNPFNPVTVIEYVVPERTNVSLTVYNMAGQQISKLVDGIRNAGHHKVTFNGKNIPNGVYVYFLEVNGQRLGRKMILMK